MHSTASLNGHPIHAILIAFPIALFVTVALMDFLHHLRREDDLWARSSYAILVMGVIWTFVAAVPGLVDYFTMPMPGISTYHLVIGLVIAVYYLALAFLRRPPTPGSHPKVMLPLSIFGVMLISAQGYLGGELVYRYHIGVLPTASNASTSLSTVNASAAQLSAVDLTSAKAVFKAKCLSCHAITGMGGGDVGPALTHEGATRSKSWISDQIKNPNIHTPGSGMPAFPNSALPAPQRESVAAFLAALK